MRDFFKGSEYEVSYGDVMLGPALFQDDVSRLCDDPVSAQMGNDRMEAMAETKLLDFNMDKSCLIIIGKKSARSKLKKEVEQNPPLLKSQFVKQNLTNIRPCSNYFYFNCEGSSMCLLLIARQIKSVHFFTMTVCPQPCLFVPVSKTSWD